MDIKNLLEKYKLIGFYKKVYKNWLEVVFSIIIKKKKIRLVLKDGSYIVTEDIALAKTIPFVFRFKDLDPNKLTFRDGILYYENKKCGKTYGEIIINLLLDGKVIDNIGIINFEGKELKFKLNSVNFLILENFYLEQYKIDKIDGEVLDIGANIGDTAIYFALKGAEKVYAYEPLPNVAKIAEENVKLNDLQDKVIIYNEAIGAEDGYILVPEQYDIYSSGGYIVNNKGNIKIPVVSIETAIKRMKNPYLLKIDCEGCEKDILLKSDAWKIFKIIFVELHRNITKVDHKIFLKRLEEYGYTCEILSKISDEVVLYKCIKNK